jgi:hypothetical protein
MDYSFVQLTRVKYFNVNLFTKISAAPFGRNPADTCGYGAPSLYLEAVENGGLVNGEW